MRVAPERVEVEFFHLPGRRLAELGAAVAGVDAEEAGEAVQVAVAVIVVDVAAVAANDDRDLPLVVVGAHPREVQPEVALRQFLQGRYNLPARLRRDRHTKLLSYCDGMDTASSTQVPIQVVIRSSAVPLLVHNVQRCSLTLGHLPLALIGR